MPLLERPGAEIPEWVFGNQEGKPLWKSNFERRVFHKTLAKASLRCVRFHDLRHSLASRLIQNAESLAYVKDQLGHHSIKVTIDIYGHLVPGANKAVVDRLDVTGRNPGTTRKETGATTYAVTPEKSMVELRGLEPLTPRLPALCSPN
jgi:integrase